MSPDYAKLKEILGTDAVGRLEDAALYALAAAERKGEKGHEALRLLLSAVLATVVWSRTQDHARLSEAAASIHKNIAAVLSAMEAARSARTPRQEPSEKAAPVAPIPF